MHLRKDSLGRAEIVGEGDLPPARQQALPSGDMAMSQYVRLRKDLVKKLAQAAKTDQSGRSMNQLVSAVQKEPMYAAFALVDMAGNGGGVGDGEGNYVPLDRSFVPSFVQGAADDKDAKEAATMRDEMRQLMAALIKKNNIKRDPNTIGVLSRSIDLMEKSSDMAKALYELSTNFGPGMVSDLFQISALAWRKHGAYLTKLIGQKIGMKTS